MDDCGDNSDEEECPSVTCDTEIEFQCGSDKQCLPKRWHCDGEYDCLDRSDEKNCPKPTCQADFFRCNNTRCVPTKWVCDGTDDCGDRSDESTCDNSKFDKQIFFIRNILLSLFEHIHEYR